MTDNTTYWPVAGLGTTIKAAIDALPVYCRGGEDVGLETHEWINAYGDPDLESFKRNRIKQGTQMLPYYMCKHCHAVSNDKITSPYIKRVR